MNSEQGPRNVKG